MIVKQPTGPEILQKLVDAVSSKDAMNVSAVAGSAAFTLMIYCYYRIANIRKDAIRNMLWKEGPNAKKALKDAVAASNPLVFILTIQNDFMDDWDKSWNCYEREYKRALDMRTKYEKSLASLQASLTEYEARTGKPSVVIAQSIEVTKGMIAGEDVKVRSSYAKLIEIKALEQDMIIAGGVAIGSIVHFLYTHPDVFKALITSIEKVTVRAIDEMSEVIDKTGEAAKDAFWGMVPFA